MNKIYLFLLAMIASSYGFNAKAYVDVYLHFDNGYGSEWEHVLLKETKSNEFYEADFELKIDYPKFNLTSDNGDNKWVLWNDTYKIGIEDSQHKLKKIGKNDSGLDATFDFKAGKYHIRFNPSYDGHKEAEVWITSLTPVVPSSSDYYFYGDMNMWSSHLTCDEDGKGLPVEIYTFEDSEKKTNIAGDVFNGKIPNHYSKAELEKWKFKKVEANTKYATFLGNSIANWYYLDFANLYDGEGHRGRLCGQFKITMGNHDNGDNWGLTGGANDNGDPSTTYLGKYLQTGSGNSLTGEKGTYKQNFHLEANYVTGAVLYFNPTANNGNGSLKLEGTPVYNYVYYVWTNGTPSESNIQSCTMDVESQLNYLVNKLGFNGTNASYVNIGGNKDTGKFHWESGSFKHPVTGKTYNGLRRRIPAGSTHRFPTQVNIKFKDDVDGDVINYPTARVLCDDIWFIRPVNLINVYFRFDDDAATASLDWVAFNVFNTDYDRLGVPVGYNYLFNGYYARTATSQPRITDGEYAVMQYVESHTKPGETKSHHWWKSPVAIPSDFSSNSYVIFGDSRGGIYPIDRVKSDDVSLADFELHGEDLYYVATTKDNPSLLYSHLNGTFKLSESSGGFVQINAEFFEPESMIPDDNGDRNPVIVTDTKAVKYKYEIWKDGVMIETSTSSDGTGFIEDPYYDWVLVSGKTPGMTAKATYGAGYYYVVVKALYDGQIYTAQDTYAIY